MGVETHTVFDGELSELEQLVVRMMSATDEQLQKAMESLIAQNQILASQTVRKDEEINRLQRAVDENSLKALALRQPVASDLRRIIAAGKMAADLERIADYASNIASNGLRLDKAGADLADQFKLHRHMADIAHDMMQEVKGAFLSYDHEAANDIWRRDREIDDLYAKLMRHIQNETSCLPEGYGEMMIMLHVGRALERIGDHITNLAEHLVFAVTGKTVAKPK